MTPAEKRLVRLLLRREQAAQQLLAAYRAGMRRTPGKAIDTLTDTRDVPDQVRAMLATEGDVEWAHASRRSEWEDATDG